MQIASRMVAKYFNFKRWKTFDRECSLSLSILQSIKKRYNTENTYANLKDEQKWQFQNETIKTKQ